ncbi:hypothetical protein DNTS_016964 [Danionella cerebrum]|uniref:Sushi domain-containing protein n=1 Tax=Danionella cerebrum TaxID=2873325 RepID=A0A553RK72_9TELE|nr:hypothetical protein DNTS_016964 [Danionella translucida]
MRIRSQQVIISTISMRRDALVPHKLQSSSCGNPGVPPKGILYGTRFNVGDKIRFSCVTGYVLDGHPQLTCVTNTGNTAVWDFPVPICRGKHSSENPETFLEAMMCMNHPVPV